MKTDFPVLIPMAISLLVLSSGSPWPPPVNRNEIPRTGNTLSLATAYNLTGLVRCSEVIVIGVVKGSRGSPFGSAVHADVVIEVEKYLKNIIHYRGDHVLVRTLSGDLGNGTSVVIEDEPEFSVGEKVLLFLKSVPLSWFEKSLTFLRIRVDPIEFDVVGGLQGKHVIEADYLVERVDEAKVIEGVQRAMAGLDTREYEFIARGDTNVVNITLSTNNIVLQPGGSATITATIRSGEKSALDIKLLPCLPEGLGVELSPPKPVIGSDGKAHLELKFFARLSESSGTLTTHLFVTQTLGKHHHGTVSEAVTIFLQKAKYPWLFKGAYAVYKGNGTGLIIGLPGMTPRPAATRVTIRVEAIDCNHSREAIRFRGYETGRLAQFLHDRRL